MVADAALRLGLAELWNLIRHGPRDLTLAYRTINDTSILREANRLGDELAEGRLGWAVSEDWSEQALSLGAQLRALDHELAGRPSFSRLSTMSFHCPEVGAFVIPRIRPKPVDQPIGPGCGFGRRATPHHRILPESIGSLTVTLVTKPLLSCGSLAGSTRNLGAAMLPGMVLSPEPEPGPYFATSASCDNDAQIIRDQVAAAFDEDAFAMVWPELSMPDDRRAVVEKALDARARSMQPGGPAIVVTGSWHETIDEERRNVLRVLDKTGKEQLSFLKLAPYQRGDVREDVVAGDTIPVVVNLDALVTFGICLDFCDVDVPVPYLELDVDLVLVASHGNNTTMKGHEANAGKLRTDSWWANICRPAQRRRRGAPRFRLSGHSPGCGARRGSPMEPSDDQLRLNLNVDGIVKGSKVLKDTNG